MSDNKPLLGGLEKPVFPQTLTEHAKRHGEQIYQRPAPPTAEQIAERFLAKAKYRRLFYEPDKLIPALIRFTIEQLQK